MELREESGLSISGEDRGDRSFDDFFVAAEPLLRRALVGAFGPTLGVEAASEALSYGWANWDRLKDMENPRGYLYRVGEHWAFRQRKHVAYPEHPIPDPAPERNFEPALGAGLNALSPRQRQAVVLVHAYGHTYAETAELLGLSRATVQVHVRRGVQGLRAHLGVDE